MIAVIGIWVATGVIRGILKNANERMGFLALMILTSHLPLLLVRAKQAKSAWAADQYLGSVSGSKSSSGLFA